MTNGDVDRRFTRLENFLLEFSARVDRLADSVEALSVQIATVNQQALERDRILAERMAERIDTLNQQFIERARVYDERVDKLVGAMGEFTRRSSPPTGT